MYSRINRGDIFHVDLQDRGGREQRGQRPCVIVSNHIANQVAPVVTVVPLTSSRVKNNLPTHISLDMHKYHFRSPTIALAEQVTVVDKNKLLGRHPYALSSEDLALLEQALLVQLGIAT